MNSTKEQQQLEHRQEIAARHLVVHLLRNAISNFRLLCHRRVITVGRDVEFHWPKSWSALGTRHVYREKVAGFNNKEEVIQLVKFLSEDPNPLLEAFGIHLHGRDLKHGFQGEAGGIRYVLASVDAIDFRPIPV